MSRYFGSLLSVTQRSLSLYIPTLTLLGTAALLAATAPVALAGGEECIFNSPVPGLTLQSLKLDPSVVESRSQPKGEVVLSRPAPVGGVAIALGTNFYAANPGYCVVVPEGDTSATFSVFTYEQTTTTRGFISASYNGTMLQAPLTVTPK